MNLFDATPSRKPMLANCQLQSREHISENVAWNISTSLLKKELQPHPHSIPITV